MSLRNIGPSLQRVVLRFPLAVGFLCCLTFLLSYFVVTDTEPLRGTLCLTVFLSVGIFISIAASLWGEEHTDKRLRWAVEGISLTLWGGYCVLLFMTDIIPDRGLPAFYIGHAAWIVAIGGFLLFGSFLKEKDDLKAWHFLCKLAAALLISGIVSWVMIGGVEGLVFGTGALFDFKPNTNLTLVIIIVGAVMLFGLLFLALIPHGERKHNNSPEMPSFLKKTVSWLLLPLLGCYILVLYVYGISILVHWELPKGMISLLVSAVMIGYVLCLILLYPEVTKRDTWQSRLLTYRLPVIILPLLVLMSVGVARRFVDYGITAPRLYLLSLLLWFYAICVVMLVVPRKRFSWISLSFIALFLLTSGHPLNYYRICRPVLEAKIDRMMEEKNLHGPLDIYTLKDNSALSAEEADCLYGDLTYMRDNYGKDYASRWIKTDSSNEERDTTRTETWGLAYYTSGYDFSFPCPQGYKEFRRINRWCASSLSEDSLYGGVLHVGLNYSGKDYVLLFDTAAVSAAKADGTALIVSSQGNQVAFVLDDFDLTAYSDSTLYLRYDGWLFTKD